MKIDLTELLGEVGNSADIEESEEVSYPEDGLILTKPVTMKLHFVNTGNLVILTGKAETETELECSRCLNKYRLPLSLVINEEFIRDREIPRYKKGTEIELQTEDFFSPIEKDDSINISEIIRQNLLLALPIKPLCTKNCQGPKGK